MLITRKLDEMYAGIIDRNCGKDAGLVGKAFLA